MATLDRPKIEYRTPPDLVSEVTSGRLRIPDFQRGFKWGPRDVLDLFDSIWRGFPIGNLLLWLRPAPATRVQVGPLVVDAPAFDAAYWVVDGQQRITSLVGALTSAETSTDVRFRIHLDLERGSFQTLGLRQQPPGHWLPVSYLVDTSAMLGWWRRNNEWLNDGLVEVADMAAKAIREYQIPTYVVTADDELQLRRIFDRLNNTGKPMTKAEVFHALHAGMVGDEPSDLRGIGTSTAKHGFGRIDARLALRCVLAYRGGDIFRDDFHQEFRTDNDREETFHEVGTILGEVVTFLQRDAGIPHTRLVPYTHILPVLTRFVSRHGEPLGRVARLLRRWIWRGAVAGSQARATSVAAIRQAVAAVDASGAHQAAEELLRLLPRSSRFTADLEKVHLNHAAAKINLLGLLSVTPRDLRHGLPLNVATLYDGGEQPVRTITKGDAVPLARSFANRAVVGPMGGDSVRQLLASADSQVASSHLVDEIGQGLLAAGDDAAFLARRAMLVKGAIEEHVNSMAEWGARDGRAIAEMMREAA